MSMLKIALTGNIASGKSLVEEMFKTSGYETFCLDRAVDFIYKNNEEFKNFLKKEFNTVNKSEISKYIFTMPDKLALIESKIYPVLTLMLEDFFKENKNKNQVIVAAPLLFEKGFDKYFDKIIFVSSKESIRKKRLMKRSGLGENEALIRVNSQEKERNKIKKSDFILYNNGSKDELEKNFKLLIKAPEFLL